MLTETRKASEYEGFVKHSDEKSRPAWKSRVYPVPNPSPRAFRWKASMLRHARLWNQRRAPVKRALVVVPALYNRFPAEAVAMGWLNEVDALHTIRQRISAVARKTGWDVFTFHTQYNLDHFFDTTISALRETWSSEGRLSKAAVNETRRRFATVYDYHLVQPRLVENLVFQSSLMEWVERRAQDVPIRFHVVGTALYSALTWSGALTFDAAVDSAAQVGARWDRTIRTLAEERAARSPRGSTEAEVARHRFDAIQRLTLGHENLALAVSRDDVPKVDSPSRPFWFSCSGGDSPTLIETAKDAAFALELLNLKSWTCREVVPADDTVRGWLISPLHAMAGLCRWSLSNYLLATPPSVVMFMDHIATMARTPAAGLKPEVQSRFRLSRMKV